MKYMKYWTAKIVGFLLAAFAWFMLVHAQEHVATVSARIMNLGYSRKKAAAEAVDGPKILVIGGSNCLSGIRASLLAKELGIPAVNMCLWGGFGLEYMLKQTTEVTRRGDIVLLVPEYQLYFANQPEDMFVDYLYAYDPDFIHKGGWLRSLRFQLSMGEDRLFIGLLNRHRGSDLLTSYPVPARLYGRLVRKPIVPYQVKSRRNAVGDELSNSEPRPAAANLDVYRVRGDADKSAAWSELDEFLDWARENGVRVLATYPTTVISDEYRNGDAVRLFRKITTYYSSRNIPLLGTPGQFMYPPSEMFDSCYHVVATVADSHTHILALLMKPYINHPANDHVARGMGASY